jgi:uncharacterized protein
VNFDQNLKDRKLGHEWYGWDGNVDSHEAFIREPKRLFMAMLFFTFFIGFAIACLLVWGLYPRLDPLHLGTASLAVVGSVAALFLALYGMLSFTLVTGIPLRASEAVSLHLFRVFPAIALVADRLGISKDRLGYSLLEIHNELTRISLRKFSNGRILCLAPRCLDRETVEQIRSLAAEYDCDFYMAPAGSQARPKIVQVKPAAIIGIACERDLVTGIRDVGYRIPVIAITNKRPAGPCKGAFIDLNELREAIEAFKARFDMPAPASAEELPVAAQTR